MRNRFADHPRVLCCQANSGKYIAAHHAPIAEPLGADRPTGSWARETALAETGGIHLAGVSASRTCAQWGSDTVTDC